MSATTTATVPLNWRCGFCEATGSIKTKPGASSLRVFRLVLAMHRGGSPACKVKDLRIGSGECDRKTIGVKLG